MKIENIDNIELKVKSIKKELIENITKNYDKIISLKNLEKYNTTNENDKKYLDFYKMNNNSTIELYHYNTKNYHFTLFVINENENKIYFFIRDSELDNYFKNYFKSETIENITKLSNKQIIEKLNKFNFLIYKDIITLLHNENDFILKK